MNLVSQEEFAQLSGDYNPLHMDLSCAQRSGYTSRIVHGVNTLLTLCEELASEDHRGLSARCSFDVRFHLPIYEHEKLLEITLDDVVNVMANKQLSLSVENTGKPLLGLTSLEISSSNVDFVRLDSPVYEVREEDIAALTESQIVDAVGKLFRVRYQVNQEKARALFPNLHRNNRQLIEDLCFITYIVGTRIPGLRSILSGINYRQGSGAQERRETMNEYYVRLRKYRQRASFGVLEFFDASGSRIANVDVFYRPEICNKWIGSELISDELIITKQWGKGQSALVLGASGGIGMEVATLLSLYGFKTTATYYRNPNILKKRQGHLKQLGRSLNVVRYDSNDHSLPTGKFGVFVDCTTPDITSLSRREISIGLCLSLASFYLHTLSKIVEAVGDEKATVCIPSSSAIDDIPVGMVEYAAAKAGLETLIGGYKKTKPNISFCCPRLHRVSTKQTLSVLRLDGILSATQAAQELLASIQDVHMSGLH